MSLSYRNLIDEKALSGAITSGDFSKVIKKPGSNSAKYIKGYANDTAMEALANSLGVNKSTLKQSFGLENKELDAYDPYHTSDAKGEEFWYDDQGSEIDGKAVQLEHDEDTNTFKRALYSNNELGGYGQTDFWYEDPFIPTFELFFDDESPLFIGGNDDGAESATAPHNSLKKFIQKYKKIDGNSYSDRYILWQEFNKVFFKIFEKDIKNADGRNKKNKAYYISKIQGLDNLNKKIINYGEDKITITLNEDVSMFAWYMAELYNNLTYSYKNQRHVFPENTIRFNMVVKINEMNNYQIPESNNESSEFSPVDKNYLDNKSIKNMISKKSEILYTLYDCTFNFFESRNYTDELEIGGYGAGASTTPQSLSFNIHYKSVTRGSNFPLIDNSLPLNTTDNLIDVSGKQEYHNTISYLRQSEKPEKKGYLNKLLSKAAQTVTNQGLNYLDNLETKLRETRGSAVNGLLSQFREHTKLNKIEPDNVYNPDFNDRTSLENFGKSLGSSLLNDLEDTARDAANF